LAKLVLMWYCFGWTPWWWSIADCNM